MNRGLLLLPLAPLMLSACASVNSYPSLAARPAERAYGTAPVASASPAPAPAPTVAPDSPLAERIAAARSAAEVAHERFRKGEPAAERLTSGSAAPQSDGWSQAQVAVSELIAARTQASGALADLDRLLVEAEDANAGEAALATIGEARDAVTRTIGEEDAVLARVAGRLKE